MSSATIPADVYVKSGTAFDGFDLNVRPEDFPTGNIPDAVLLNARVFLSLFVTRQARQAADALGFSWAPSADAPDSVERLGVAFAHSDATGDPLPVSSLHTMRVLFTSAEANIAFRFWHDVSHVQRLRTFEPVHEIDLALWHLAVLEAEGIEPGSLIWRLLHADLIGQTLCSALVGRFPDDQLEFDLNCVIFGLDDALVMEFEKFNQLPQTAVTQLALPVDGRDRFCSQELLR